MSTQFKFQTNVPATVQFSYDQSKSYPDGEFGPSFMYGGTINGIPEMHFYATPTLHDFLTQCGAKKGVVATIAKKEAPEDAKIKYWEVTIDGIAKSSRDMVREQPAPVPVSAQRAQQLGPPAQPIPTHTELIQAPIIAPSKPIIDTIVNTYKTIYQKVAALSCIPAADRREVATSIFIQAGRMDIFVAASPSAPPFNDVPPQDDLPF